VCLDVPPGSLPRGIACAPGGKVYLTGAERHHAGDAINSWWLRAVGPDGASDDPWRRRFEGRAYFFRPNAIALDGKDSLYVAGQEGGVDWNAEPRAWIR